MCVCVNVHVLIKYFYTHSSHTSKRGVLIPLGLGQEAHDVHSKQSLLTYPHTIKIACTLTRMHACTHMRTCSRMQTHAQTLTHANTYRHACAHAHTCTQDQMLAHIHMHTHMQACQHGHTHKTRTLPYLALLTSISLLSLPSPEP